MAHPIVAAPLAARNTAEKIRNQDLGGEDPLPRYLKEAQVSFEHSPVDEKEGRNVRSRNR